MHHPAQTTTPPQDRSALDRLADRAPERFRTQAGAAALAVDKLATATRRAKSSAVAQVRSRPLPYAFLALAVGAGVGLIAYGPTRRWIGSSIAKASRTSVTGLASQLGRELRSRVR